MTCIGILHTGSMGSAVASSLLNLDIRTVTTGDGRSEQSLERAVAAGVESVATLADVVNEADIVLSLVPSDVAISVAQEVAEAYAGGPLLFVEANAISVSTFAEVNRILSAKRIDIVDAAIHGSAENLTSSGVLFVCGSRATEISELFGLFMKVKYLGIDTGQASAMKMLTGGLNKGLAALFIELASAARSGGYLDEVLEVYEELYPGIMTVIRRVLPSYCSHSGRRIAELAEIESTVEHWGSSAAMAAAARETISRIDGSVSSFETLEQCIEAWSSALSTNAIPPEE